MPEMYSMRACPYGCSGSAGLPAILKPSRVITEEPASERLLTASAVMEMLWNSSPTQRLYQKEKDVGKDAHHRSQNTVALAHLRLLGLLVVGNKVPNQKLYHENSSSLFGSLGWSPQMKDRADSGGIPYKNDLTTTIDCTAK